MSVLIQEDDVWQPCASPAPGLSPLPLKTLSGPFDIPESLEYWQACRLTSGSPFESSDSDSCSDSDDGTLSVVSANQSPYIRECSLSSGICPVDWSDIGIPAGVEENALGLIFSSQACTLEARAIATPIPQAGSLRAPPNHQDVRSCDRPNRDCHSHQRHAATPSYVPANDTLVGGCPQDIRLRGDVSDASVLRKLQELRWNQGPENWLGAGEPGQGADDDAVNAWVVGGKAYDPRLQYAPQMRSVALPDEEAARNSSEGLLYSGPGLGGWLTGTAAGVPETVTLSPLKIALPFLAEDDLHLMSAEFSDQEYGTLCDEGSRRGEEMGNTQRLT
ncbi:hypothetical protein BJV78DRAFT_1283550 [Lactifluus subvellereus]|nr:hypothetical protein BJV78DRAFT_1283550 [Lactifluus subvellereus]